MTKLLPQILLLFVLFCFNSTFINAQDFDTACQNSQPFCSDASLELTFPNTIGDIDGLGEVGCLNTTPNPSWYFLLIDESGELVFDIRQWVDADGDNRLDRNERQLDVDFIAWGPFQTSFILDCEDQLARGCDVEPDDNVRPAECVNNVDDPDFYTTNLPLGQDNTNIVDCSYARTSDDNFIETFTIPNAQTGEFYIVLITNFADEAGVIQLEQTNLGEDGAGTTDCSVLEPGIPQDRIAVCGAGEFPVIVEGRFPRVEGPPEIPAAVAFEWFVLNTTTGNFDSTGVQTPFYSVPTSGTYQLRGYSDFVGGNEVGRDEVVVLDISSSVVSVDYSITEESFSGFYTLTAQVTSTPEAEAGGFTDFEYRLDRDIDMNGNFVEYRAYQSSPVFEGVPPGDYRIIARYANCPDSEITSVDIMILGYPKYFTPNGDGFHETWNLINPEDQPTPALVYIFDRHGKLLKQLNPAGAGWDGTYNGNLMPSSQYWFRVEFNEQADRDPNRGRRVFAGSFSLIR
ncbi:T9SS type B sorting domain-containing protein [Aquimarina rubra]|uniref:T9SS type B sorting domain-containing protein n=1 Tax=Aquimarina rubra TaxID=1920033 RepID=A0ABW5LJX3_9FLAO